VHAVCQGCSGSLGVHEALEFGLLGPGDRIGHGLVLGCNLEAWFEQNANWLDRARQAGMDSRLTCRASTEVDSLAFVEDGWWAAARRND
jgi:hypothetical protein